MLQPEKIGESRSYWTHEVATYPNPVAVTRMAQLIDFDERLYENARIVYRFLISWYHRDHGDALLSMRHVSKVMRARAPEGSTVLSHSVVQRAVIALMETGWVVRTFKGRGKGKGASRYVPVLNVLELAAQGKFPEPSHSSGTVEPSHSSGTVVSRTNGTVDAELSHSNGTKTLLPDPRTDAETGKEEHDSAAPSAPPGPGLEGRPGADPAQGGFDELYRVYGVRKEYAAGKFEYEKIAPSSDVHAEMVASAKAWRTAAGGIERMHLARWIREDRYKEDPKGERKTKPKPSAANQNTKPAAEVEPFTERRETLTIIGASVGPAEQDDEGDTVKWLDLTFRRHEDGNEDLGESYVIECSNAKRQEKGQADLQRFLDALDISPPDDSEELVGVTFVRTVRSKFGQWEYERMPDAEREVA